MKLFLIRHTQTSNTLNGEFRYNGHIDVDVDENGLKILDKLIPYIKKFQIKRIYSSDLTRAKKGASVFANALKLPVFTSKKLREVKQGRWEGLTYNEIIAKYHDEAEKKFRDYVNYKVIGGESLKEASARVMSFINIIKEKHKNDNIIIVAHGGINMLILLNALNMDLIDFFRIQQDFGCLNEIDYSENFTKVIRMNYVPKLTE